MIISMDDLYIIVCSSDSMYSRPSGDTDHIYTDRAQAQAECDRRNAEPAQYSVKLKYHVQDLYDYMRDQVSDARLDC